MKDFSLLVKYLYLLFFPGDLRATLGQDPAKLPTTTALITERDMLMAGTSQILTLMRLTRGPVILTGETMRGRGIEETIGTLVASEISARISTEDGIKSSLCTAIQM